MERCRQAVLTMLVLAVLANAGCKTAPLRNEATAVVWNLSGAAGPRWGLLS